MAMERFKNKTTRSPHVKCSLGQIFDETLTPLRQRMTRKSHGRAFELLKSLDVPVHLVGGHCPPCFPAALAEKLGLPRDRHGHSTFYSSIMSSTSSPLCDFRQP